ncbi:scavenger receptor class B member 1 isoform X2 [Balaenoptera musculus]|uniref:Scavenger receptor class B member 1 n=1 Tax=Balaenoptera musculus TaxID=9771 RepID=A0A8B8V2D9_BALMU|nr:scavenger receptor class B member 1 isoform X2 [Balaenoptera musculus]
MVLGTGEHARGPCCRRAAFQRVETDTKASPRINQQNNFRQRSRRSPPPTPPVDVTPHSEVTAGHVSQTSFHLCFLSCQVTVWRDMRTLLPWPWGLSWNVRIDPSSLSFNMWKEIPVPFYLSVYFFDVINPRDILQGQRPQVRERGPYVYREFRHKSNITFNDNDTVSFLEYRSFQFQPDKSRGLESDNIVMPNILVLSAAMMMENGPMSLKLIMTLAFSTLGERAFMNRTVSEIMWGYEDPLIHLINKYFPNMFPFKGKFGLFAELNNSDSGLFTVFTGVKNFSRIHLVDKWNGVSKVNFWHSDQCNMINGTSGQMWAPFMTPESSLEFYSPEACRSMKLIYKEQGVFEGIPTFRFVAPNTLFANGSVYPPNEGFCPCRESGIQNVSTCRFNAPLFLSHPHFYNADPVLAEAVSGLHPNPEEHSLFLDVHPVTGIPMNCSVKLQLSLYIKSVKGIGQTGKIEPVILPLMWFGESGAMEGETLQTFYTQLVLMPKVLHYAQYVLLALGCVLLLIPIVYQIRSQGPKDAASQPRLATQPDQLSSPYTPLLQDSLSGQPTNPEV